MRCCLCPIDYGKRTVFFGQSDKSLDVVQSTYRVRDVANCDHGHRMFSAQCFCSVEIQHTGAIYRDGNDRYTKAGFELLPWNNICVMFSLSYKNNVTEFELCSDCVGYQIQCLRRASQ